MPEVVNGGADLRPIERVVMRLHGDGLSLPDIGKRIGKKPGTVHRIIQMVDFKEGVVPGIPASGNQLRPLERVVVKLRARGESYGEIGNRLARSGRQVRMIEGYADFKLRS